jgi:fumarylacetoacetate (FAA) hydrolase family protein
MTRGIPMRPHRNNCLPPDAALATVTGRIWLPNIGSALVTLSDVPLLGASWVAATSSEFINLSSPAKA